MILAWRSKKYTDMVLFERVICVAESGSGSAIVKLEGNIGIVLDKTEIDEFFEAFETYLAIQEVIALGLVEDDNPIPRRKGDSNG